jgi:cysteine desulfurase / selenocysteine lyase
MKNYKDDFVIFDQKVNGHHFIYLDSASTSQKPHQVIDAEVSFYETYCANVGRGIYSFAEAATYKYEQTRQLVAQFFNVQSHEIIFTKGATEGINLVMQSWARKNLVLGDEIIVSDLEHHSNLVPWQQLVDELGIRLIIAPTNEQGVITPEILSRYLSSRVKLMALFHTSNVTGSSNDIQELVKMAHEMNVKVLVDACQSAAQQRIDIKQLGCDFLVCSSHKMLGSTGLGILYVKDTMYSQMRPYQFGGGMVSAVSYGASSYRQAPHGFEAGTPPIAQVISFSEAIRYLEEVDFDAYHAHTRHLVDLLHAYLQTVSHVKIISVAQSCHIVSFYSTKYHAHDVAAYLDQFGIAVRAGNHCAQPYHDKKGIVASVRISLYLYTSLQDIQTCIEKLDILFKQ